MFHMSFGSSFCILLNLSRRFLTGSNDMDKMSDSYFAEFVCMIIPGDLDGFYIELEIIKKFLIQVLFQNM